MIAKSGDEQLEAEVNMEFKNLGINSEILRAIDEQGYTTPTPIQEQSIPKILEGNDILGLAQTGTGKTAAFALPTLQRLSEAKTNKTKKHIRALVLTPTRELGIQIFESFKTYGKYVPLKTTVIFGGVNQTKQISTLRSGVDVLVATPGRLLDLIKQKHIDLSMIEIFVLDEADRMLDMGFIHDIRRVVSLLPKKKQTLFFSATMPKEMEEIVDNLLVNPTQVSVTPVSSTVATVEQFAQYVDQNHKTDLLVKLLKEKAGEQMLVFTRTKHGANKVVKDLLKHDITAQAIHGNKSQNARQLALGNFKANQTQVLVATDIASRGIDIHELSYVVNYDMPDVPETYVHRIGRTGRAGYTGQSISYISFQEIEMLKDVEKLIKKKIKVLANEQYPLIDKSEKKKPMQSKRSKSTKPAKQVKPTRKPAKKTEAKSDLFKRKYSSKLKTKNRKKEG